MHHEHKHHYFTGKWFNSRINTAGFHRPALTPLFSLGGTLELGSDKPSWVSHFQKTDLIDLHIIYYLEPVQYRRNDLESVAHNSTNIWFRQCDIEGENEQKMKRYRKGRLFIKTDRYCSRGYYFKKRVPCIFLNLTLLLLIL